MQRSNTYCEENAGTDRNIKKELASNIGIREQNRPKAVI
jgi:hypothetical protein